MLVLDYTDAHKFVQQQRKMGVDIRWDGYDMILFKKTPHGFNNQKGAFRKGRCGIEIRVSPDSLGMWSVVSRNVQTNK